MSRRGLALAALGFLLSAAALSFGVGSEVRIPVGGARGPILMTSLGPSEAATGLDADESRDDRRTFYFRRIESPEASVSIPLNPSGPFGLAVRMDSTVRTLVEVRQGAQLAGSNYVTVGPWSRTSIVETGLTVPDFALAFHDAPLVGRSDADSFRRYIDELIVRSGGDFTLPWSARIWGGLTTSFIVLLVANAGGSALAAAALSPAVLWVLSQYEPVGTALALPRLALFAGVASLLSFALSRRLGVSAKPLALVTLLSGSMVWGCGFLSFLPDHSPADLDIHIWRTLDLKDVAPTYEAWLRYGSHYPTPSQTQGAATDALGNGPPIPYSPLPYVFFYAAHALGLDLHWSMNAMEATALSLLLPFVFAFAQRAAGEGAARLATFLMALDLPTIHHLGRAHSPAVLGGALGLAGLLAFGLMLPQIRERGVRLNAGLVLGIGALGYSSTPLFYALFGTALLGFLSFDATSRKALVPTLAALTIGGLLALGLFYGHFIPGLIQGGAASMTSDPFPGRTFFIFHNESRQSLRLWRLGLYIPLLGTLAASVPLLKGSAPMVRSFLGAWLAAFAGIMVLKEPFAFARVLRWAKEDFYIAPATALIVACAIASIESKRWRNGLTALSLAVALFLRLRDYGFHANTLRFLQ